jgi:hypothetical protein
MDVGNQTASNNNLFPVYMDASLIGYDPSLCFCAYTATPDYNGASIRRMNPRTNNFQYFDTSPFSVPSLLSFGTARHRFFSGPGINNWDMALHGMTLSAITSSTLGL